MTTNEAAAALGVSDARVRLLCSQGRLSAIKKGRDWWIPPRGVAEFERRSPGRKRKGRR